MARALLLDIDGTLTDSTYLHVHAWVQALHDVGHLVPAWQVHRAIGMGADQLLEALLPDADADAGLVERAKESHSRRYADLAPLLRALPGADKLVAAARRKGLAVVLASSASREELDRLSSVLGFLDDVEVVDSDAVAAAKPEPDVVHAALERAGVPAGEAVFVGDSVWDVEACRRAGVACVAVLTGGVSREALAAAGAVAVVEGLGEVLGLLDGPRRDGPLPGPGE